MHACGLINRRSSARAISAGGLSRQRAGNSGAVSFNKRVMTRSAGRTSSRWPPMTRLNSFIDRRSALGQFDDDAIHAGLFDDLQQG